MICKRIGSVVLLAGFFLTGCTGWQSALDTHGTPAERLFELIVLITVVCTAVWLMVIGVLALALWRRREGPGVEFEVIPRTERRMMITVVAGIAATVVVITVFTVASFVTTRSLTLASDNDLTIQVRGLQWWWDV